MNNFSRILNEVYEINVRSKDNKNKSIFDFNIGDIIVILSGGSEKITKITKVKGSKKTGSLTYEGDILGTLKDKYEKPLAIRFNPRQIMKEYSGDDYK